MSKSIEILSVHPNAEEALRELPCLKPDVILMDIKLPGMWRCLNSVCHSNAADREPVRVGAQKSACAATDSVSEWIAEIKRVWARGSGSTLDLARVVSAAKNRLQRHYGQWSRLWRSEEKMPVSKSTADRLATVGDRMGWADSATSLNLPRGWNILYCLARLDRPKNTHAAAALDSVSVSACQRIIQICTILVCIQLGAGCTTDSFSRPLQRHVPRHVNSLCKAASKGDTKAVERLLAAGTDPNLQGRYGNAALHCAAESGITNVIPVLLRYGAKIDGRNFVHFTPLMVAASSANCDVVRVLVANGADSNLTSEGGDTALMFAARGRGFPPADSGVKRNTERTAEEKALDVRYFEIVRLLLQHGAEVNRRARGGITALGLAEASGNAEIINALKAAGARR